MAAGPDLEYRIIVEMTGWQPPFVAHEQTGPLTLAATDLRHPVFRPFGALSANLGQVRFDRAWRVTEDGWSVVARFSNGTPALLERAMERGRVVLFASDVDRRWNDFPLHPAFVPFALEALRYVWRGREPCMTTGRPAPAEAPSRSGCLSGTDGRPFAVNVDTRESALSTDDSGPIRAADRAFLGRHVASCRKAGAADRVAPELLAVRPGPDDCYTGCRVGGRPRVTVHDRLRSLLLSVRRRWRAEVVLRAFARVCAFVALPLFAAAVAVAVIAPGDGVQTILAVCVGPSPLWLQP